MIGLSLINKELEVLTDMAPDDLAHRLEVSYKTAELIQVLLGNALDEEREKEIPKVERMLGRKLEDDERLSYKVGYLELYHTEDDKYVLRASSKGYEVALGGLNDYK